MKIGIVGNREGWTLNEVRDTLKDLGFYKSDMIISGGAKGVDGFAQEIAKEIGSEILICYPDPDKPSPERYFHRNKIIAMKSDILVAFNKKDKSGTSNTIRHAKELDKTVIVVSAKGIYEFINKK